MKDNIDQIATIIIKLKKLNQLQEMVTSVASKLSEHTYLYPNPVSREMHKRKARLLLAGYHGVEYTDKVERTYLEDLKDIISKEHECLIESLADVVKRSRIINHSDQSPNEDTTSSE